MIGPSAGSFPDSEFARVRERVSWFTAPATERDRTRFRLRARWRLRPGRPAARPGTALARVAPR